MKVRIIIITLVCLVVTWLFWQSGAKQVTDIREPVDAISASTEGSAIQESTKANVEPSSPQTPASKHRSPELEMPIRNFVGPYSHLTVDELRAARGRVLEVLNQSGLVERANRGGLIEQERDALRILVTEYHALSVLLMEKRARELKGRVL